MPVSYDPGHPADAHDIAPISMTGAAVFRYAAIAIIAVGVLWGLAAARRLLGQRRMAVGGGAVAPPT